jgi:hypothetical protein
MIEGQFAGWLTGWSGPLLPAAATINVPAAAARCAAVSNTVE